MTEIKRPFAPGKFVYDEETFLKIAELPVCSVFPDFLSKEFCNDFDGPNGPVRLWCPNRWIQNVWHQEEAEKLKNKGQKSAAISIPDGEGRREALDRLKSESEDGIVLSPQRRSFGAGCQAGLNRSTKDNVRDNARYVTIVRSRNSGRSHRYDGWRDHGAINLSGRTGGKDFSTKQRNSTANNWSTHRNEKKGSNCSSSAPKESVPEWVTNGPKDMFDTVELHGFDDDDENDNNESDTKNAIKDSSTARMTNGDHESNVSSKKVDSKSSESDFHAETDAILTRFLGLSANGRPNKSRFCQLFEQSAAAAADAKNENRKSSKGDGADQREDVARLTVPKQHSPGAGLLPGALHLEDIEAGAEATTDKTVETASAVQGFFESFKCGPKEESREVENAQRSTAKRNESTIRKQPFDGQWPNGNEMDVVRTESAYQFPGNRTVESGMAATRPYGQQQVNWRPPAPGYHMAPGYRGPVDGSLYGGRAPFLGVDRGYGTLPSTIQLSHQRNIPLDVINAIMEMQDAKRNSMAEYFTTVGFQSRDGGGPPPPMASPSGRLQSSSEQSPSPRASNMLPMSVLRQMHQDKMSNAQTETSAEVETSPTGSESTVPTFAAVAASGTKKAPNSPVPPLAPPNASPWASSGRSGQMSPQDGGRLAAQQQRTYQESWRTPSFVQQAAGYPIVRSSGVPSPQPLPVAAMQMWRARMLSHNGASMRIGNGPPPAPPASLLLPPPPSSPYDPHHPHAAMLIQKQLLQQAALCRRIISVQQNNPYYSSIYPETSRSATGSAIAVDNLFKLANIGNAAPAIPLDGKALTLEEIESQVKASQRQQRKD